MAIKRSTFKEIVPLKGIRPTERELQWFRHIACHGPQSSQYLFELTQDTHSCKDTALRQLRKLRAAGFLHLPKQQRATENANFKPYIYDLTRSGMLAQEENGPLEPFVRPTGHWWHGYSVSCVTSSIDIYARKRGIRYIPAHTMLAKRNTQLAIPLRKGSVIPDQLFALDYGGSFRAFALEVDRGTEPLSSTSARKSLVRSIDQYIEVLEKRLHKSHYGLKANLIVLWVFTSQSRQESFLQKLKERSSRSCEAIFSRTIVPDMLHREVCTSLVTKDWSSSGMRPFQIFK